MPLQRTNPKVASNGYGSCGVSHGCPANNAAAICWRRRRILPLPAGEGGVRENASSYFSLPILKPRGKDYLRFN